MNIIKWMGQHNGTIIKRTVQGAGVLIGMALLSGLTVDKGEEEEFDGFCEYDVEIENGDTADEFTATEEDQ